MTRILYILEAVEGGAWRHLRDLIDALHGVAIHCSVALSFERGCGNTEEVRSFLSARSVPLHELKMRRGAAPGDMAAVLNLTRMIRRMQPELVHAHSAKAGVLGRMAGRVAGVPVVYTPHCFPFLMKGERLARGYGFVERGVVGITAALIAVSREEAEAAHRLGYPHDRVHYIPNGIEPCGVELPESNSAGVLTLGFFGRDAPQKGSDTFVRLVAELNRRGVVCEGRMYGGFHHSPSNTANPVTEGESKGVKRYGRCPQQQVMARMRACDAVVMPSRWEGLPYTLLEALDAGVALSSYRVGGIGDVAEHGVSAMLAEAEDFDTLVENTAALADAGLRRRLAEGGRAAVRPFTLQRMAQETLDVYRRVKV